ncbi:metal-dependent hydrolase [Halobium salinum]|uniref:Metal-dependent hydrolase n=1 Tax=Halobium salinum TaxID=1364940 RepID=A0ABD5PEL3_9EURY|nr:metal-dependent hydrolase [Halobium salinum]
MQSPGHIGLALLFAAPAWLVFHGLKTNFAFAGLAASMGMYPDVDLVLVKYLFIEHHGLTHGVFFLLASALVIGAVVTGAYLAVRDGTTPSSLRVYAFVAVALFVGMMAHLVGDVLTSPDIAPPVKPLWPVVKEPIVLDAAFVKSNLWNLGPLALGIAVQTGFGIREYLDR